MGRALLLALLGVLAFAPAAFAHAQLEETTPPAGAVVRAEPSNFTFRFDQAVEGGVGAVRVFNAEGARVDNDVVFHPGGVASKIAVGLKPGLAQGTYIATYRVVSVDTHVVSGGAVFSIGHASGQGSVTVAGLLAKSKTGRVTLVAFGAVRALSYLAVGLFLGALAFLLLVWPRGLAAVSGGADVRPGSGGAARVSAWGEPPAPWGQAQDAFARRALRLLALAVALGLLSGALGFGLQGAEQAGVSFFSALNGGVLGEVRRTDFGTWWGTRLLDWALIGVLVAIAAGARARSGARPEAGGHAVGSGDGAHRHARGRAASVTCVMFSLAGLAAAYLVVTVVLSGHAYSQSPRGVLMGLDVVHVAAMSMWLGGLALLLLAVPAATRELEPADRTRLLGALLGRFSPLALGSVIALAVTGVAQAYIHVRTLNALLNTGYGHDVLAKTALLIVLIGLGCTQRERVIPSLRRSERAGRPPGEGGFLLRRVLRVELLLVVAVLGVTAALVDFVPPVVEASGPVNVTRLIGPAQLEMTVQPARVGVNEIHIYLLNAKTGSPFAGIRELTVTASLPAKRIGAQPLRAIPSGPGHYTVPFAELVPGGTWELGLAMRVSEFEEFTQEVKVPIG